MFDLLIHGNHQHKRYQMWFPGQLLLLPYTVLFWEWYELWTVLSGALAPLGWEWWLIKSLLLGLGH